MEKLSWDILLSRSYVPYSGIQMACLVKGKSGVYYPGVRVENISFPLTIDAHQAAIYSCLSEADQPDELIIPDSGSEYRFKNSFDKKSNALSSQFDTNCKDWCKWFGISCTIQERLDWVEVASLFKSNEKKPEFKRLMDLTDRCIIPYSSFPVSVLAETDMGCFSGVNIEIADWQRGLCSERVAMAKARASGAKTIHMMHIYAPESDFVSPCGACRQVMSELMKDSILILHHNHFERSRFTVGELLPYQFMAGKLNINSNQPG